MSRLFDPIRKRVVPLLPEEKIRQHWLRKMIELGYPKELLSVERELSSLPHLEGAPLPAKRRADLICFAKDIHPIYTFYPLLLVEFKAHKLREEDKEQVIGYNHYVKSPFFALANDKEIQTFWVEKGEIKQVSFLPPYVQLMKIVK